MTGRHNDKWTEKHRPRRLYTMADSSGGAIEAMKRAVSRGMSNNMLLAGPPGVGKTTAAFAFCRELFGPNWKRRVLELNASDERGIEVVRTRIKQFAMSATIENEDAEDDVFLVRKKKEADSGHIDGTKHESTPIGASEHPWLKLVILDEADQMTPDAQGCLRRTMEQFAKTTRFLILCNYGAKIIPPIISRCSKFSFHPMPRPVHRKYVFFFVFFSKSQFPCHCVDGVRSC